MRCDARHDSLTYAPRVRLWSRRCASSGEPGSYASSPRCFASPPRLSSCLDASSRRRRPPTRTRRFEAPCRRRLRPVCRSCRTCSLRRWQTHRARSAQSRHRAPRLSSVVTLPAHPQPSCRWNRIPSAAGHPIWRPAGVAEKAHRPNVNAQYSLAPEWAATSRAEVSFCLCAWRRPKRNGVAPGVAALRAKRAHDGHRLARGPDRAPSLHVFSSHGYGKLPGPKCLPCLED